MKDKTQVEFNNKTKKTKNHYILGMILGFCLVWSIGLSGFIPYIIGIFLGTVITNKVLNSEEKLIKIIFWILFAIIVIVGTFFKGVSNMEDFSSYYQEEAQVLNTDKSSENSEISGNFYKNTKYNFSILFPEGWDIGEADNPTIVQEATSGTNSINISIQQFSLDNQDQVNSIKDTSSLDDFVNSSIDELENTFGSVEIIGYGEAEINNEDVYWLRYAIPVSGELKMTSGVYSIMKNNIFYIISFGTVGDYSEKEKVFMDSISTFTIYQ